MALYNVYDDKHLLFLHIPKTAGTSIIHWLDARFDRAWVGYNPHIHKSHELLSSFATKPCTSFTVVRNPWDRIVSTYVYLAPNFGKHMGTFEQFVNRLKDPRYSIGEPRLFRPQTEWITLPIDHILKFENLSEDFKVIQDYVGSDEPLPVLNTTPHTRYQDFYNDETRQIIQDVHAEDIERFEYTF